MTPPKLKPNNSKLTNEQWALVAERVYQGTSIKDVCAWVYSEWGILVHTANVAGSKLIADAKKRREMEAIDGATVALEKSLPKVIESLVTAIDSLKLERVTLAAERETAPKARLKEINDRLDKVDHRLSDYAKDFNSLYERYAQNNIIKSLVGNTQEDKAAQAITSLLSTLENKSKQAVG